jgi:hypothetical protein
MSKQSMVGRGALCAVLALGLGCGGKTEAGGINPQMMADSLHAVMSADRTVYTREVVNRLQNKENVIKATEHWKDEKTLPLPAQMFRMGAEVNKSNPNFSYSLLSMWPINKQNAPKTDVEKEGLKFVADNDGKNFYKEEKLGEKTYFTAIYADKAIAEACITCHNEHKDTPRKDFKLNDTLGGIVIRIPLNK